jgi:hypothetical protein
LQNILLMEHLEFIKLTQQQVEKLPIVFRKLYSNIITDITVETKFFKYDARIQDIEMRACFPIKPISKIYVSNNAQSQDAGESVKSGEY